MMAAPVGSGFRLWVKPQPDVILRKPAPSSPACAADSPLSGNKAFRMGLASVCKRSQEIPASDGHVTARSHNRAASTDNNSTLDSYHYGIDSAHRCDK